MNRHYSDVHPAYYTSRQQLDSVHASGWQSPVTLAPSLPLIRIVVDCPFGAKKCDYTIDKSQRGRLIVAARRRHTFKSDIFPSKNKNNIVLQTFTIPSDGDVNYLQSHIDRSTNRLIIEIPRFNSSDSNTRNTYTNSLYSPETVLTSADKTYSSNNEKLDYRIDCHGYTADELDVFVQGRNLIVQGKTKRTGSSEQISKNFSRKIPLPDTVDRSRIASYFENGELRIEAALKREIDRADRKILSSEMTPSTVSTRTTGDFRRVQSPTPSNPQRHYRRHAHISRHRTHDHGDEHQPVNPVRRERSIESLHYPSYSLSQDFDDVDDEREHRRRRPANYERYTDNRNDSYQQLTDRSVHSPTNTIVTTRTIY